MVLGFISNVVKGEDTRGLAMVNRSRSFDVALVAGWQLPAGWQLQLSIGDHTLRILADQIQTSCPDWLAVRRPRIPKLIHCSSKFRFARRSCKLHNESPQFWTRFI